MRAFMSTFKVVVTDHNFTNLQPECSVLSDLDCEVVDAGCLTEDDVIAAAVDADALLVGGVPITARVINALQRCKIIVRYGVGYDDIDIEAATAKGIPFCNTPNAATDEVADHTMALALALARRLPLLHAKVHQGDWSFFKGFDLPSFGEMTFVTIGFGRIARAVLERAKAFRFRVGAVDPHPTRQEFESANVAYLTNDQAFDLADILCLNVPLTQETHHMVNAERLARLKPGAILINTGRGALVDTEALVAALQAGRLAYAGLDVYEEEPLPTDHPLCRLDNVLLTPHCASYSNSSMPRTQTLAAEEVRRALRGEPLHNQVNR